MLGIKQIIYYEKTVVFWYFKYINTHAVEYQL